MKLFSFTHGFSRVIESLLRNETVKMVRCICSFRPPTKLKQGVNESHLQIPMHLRISPSLTHAPKKD